MSSPKSRRAPKRRRNGASAPRAVTSTRREERARRLAAAQDERRRASRRLGREGERPRGPFGGLPVSELAIGAGLVAAVIGFTRAATASLLVGLVVCALGVMEVTGREHFSGYRAHTALLAGIPAIGVGAAVVAVFGDPSDRGLLLLVIVPVFGILFWALRRRFAIARRARVARAARGVAPPARVRE